MDGVLGGGSDVLIWQAVVLTAVSLAVGVLGGFVGLALGTMRLPTLLLMVIAAYTAGGTNILVSSISSFFGALRHLRERQVNFRLVMVMGVPAFVGAFIGGFSGGSLPETLLILAAGLLALWQGIELRIMARGLLNRAGTPNQGDGLGQFGARRILAGGAIGLAVGLLGGAVGLILGSVRLPALIRVLRIDPRIAAGTNLFIGFIMGSLGWVGHVIQGQVDYPLLGMMGAGAAAGSYYGARLTGRVALDRLVGTMGWVLLAVGAILVWQAFD